MKRHDVLCAGILVADLFTAPMPTMLAPGELSRVEDITFESGGCAANVAINLAKLECSVALSGRVGDDLFGHAVIQQLQQRSLETSYIRISDTYPTSKTVVLIVEGQDRRYVHAVGANGQYSAGDIDRALIAESKLFYVGGLMTMDKLDCEQLAPLFQYAREVGTITVLDVVVPAGSAVNTAALAKLLPYTDVFLPNDDEAAVLSGLSDPLQQARYFHDLGASCVVITCGGKGCVAIAGDVQLSVDAYPIQLVDASGGGDAFTSGFIFGELQQWPLADKLAFASALGASACRVLGCTTGTFTLDEALAFVKEHSLPYTLVQQ